MSRRSQVRKAINNIDDALFLFTGKRLKQVVNQGINLFGDQMARKVSDVLTGEKTEEVSLNSPYQILGVNPDAPDFLVKAAYKAMQKKYHPDGEKPNEEMSKLINQAYETICEERCIAK